MELVKSNKLMIAYVKELLMLGIKCLDNLWQLGTNVNPPPIEPPGNDTRNVSINVSTNDTSNDTSTNDTSTDTSNSSTESPTSPWTDPFGTLLKALGIRVKGQTLQAADVENVFQCTKGGLLTRHVYTVLVFITLCAVPVRHVIEIAIPPFVPFELFDVATEVLLPIQYVLSVVYFAHAHIEMFKDVTRSDASSTRQRRQSQIREVFVDISRQAYSEASHTHTPDTSSYEVSTLLRQPCRLTLPRMSKLVCGFSLASFVVFLCTTDFREYCRRFGAGFLPVLILSRLFGLTVLCLNATTFCFVFFKHVKVLLIYADVLGTQEWDVVRDHRISVILVNLVRIKDSLHISQELLGGIFSTATVCGATALGVFIHSASANVHNVGMWCALGSFAIIQCTFFWVIYRLNEAKTRIEKLVKSGKFASKFLSRKPSQTAEQRTLETATTVDWKVITDLLHEQWISFSVLGMPLHSADFIKQVVAATGLLVLYLQPAEIVAAG